MRYTPFLFAALAATLLWTSPVLAERLDMDYCSVDVPQGWQSLEDEYGLWLEGPEESGFSIQIIAYQAFKPEELLQSIAADMGLARLTPLGSGYVWETDGDSARHWLGIGKDGTICRIEVKKEQAKGVSPLLASIRSVKKFPQLDALFKETNSDMVAWLDFSAPAIKQEDAPDSPEVPENAAEPDRTVSHAGIIAEVCKGWTVHEGDRTLTLISPDPGTWMAAHALVRKGNDADFDAFGKKVIMAMGGFNIYILPGNIAFQLPDGVNGELGYCEPDAPCLILTSKGNPAVLDIARSGFGMGE